MSARQRFLTGLLGLALSGWLIQQTISASGLTMLNGAFFLAMLSLGVGLWHLLVAITMLCHNSGEDS